MADIELVIKIPEDTYIATCNGLMLPPNVKKVVNAIRNATPLPKGHGKIIDERQITEVYTQTTEERHVKGEIIVPRIEIIGTNAPAIIEADEGESEE